MNLADVLETVAEVLPEAEAQVDRDRRFTWAELHRRSGGLAGALLEAGLEPQDKVAQYLHNSPEYMESVLATLRAALVPVNTNYRYLDRELLYLWDNADVAAVVFHGSFTARIDAIRSRLPRIRLWLWVDDGSGPCPDWALPYERAASMEPPPRRRRSGEDLILIYTGGTTGMPKGVMWRQCDFFEIFNRDRPPRPYDTARGLHGVAEALRRDGPGRTVLPACPQMHALGFLASVTGLLNGGKLVTRPRFDAAQTWSAVERESVHMLYIVGDAFARPLLAALEREPRRWDLSSLQVIRSSGVMWSEGVKRGLLRHHPHMILRDGLGSTESIGMGRSESSTAAIDGTATFEPGPHTRVLTEALEPVKPGSGAMGRIAVGGPNPLGYYKDPEKTARTFPVIDGERYSLAGDWATVEADGRIRLLGRGSVCINTGGEKVFPEEVEEVLKELPQVADAVCVGVPDERLGEAVTAVVEPATNGDGSRAPLDGEALVAAVKARLAHYKAPRHVVSIPSMGRAPNGKVDYAHLRRYASEKLDLA